MEKKLKNIFVEGPISAEKVAHSIQAHGVKKEIGAHSIFLGQVRADIIENSTVIAIDYSSYKDLANQIAHTIREEIFEKYPLTCMHIYHSLGKVNAGEICLFVFTSSKHRKAASQACDELVERIKKELPIWGKEIFENGHITWKENV